MSSNKEIVVDARKHMLGRLASVVAKQLLEGQRVTVVRCEGICLSGGMVRQKMRYERFLRKAVNTKPSQGPFHYRAPSRFFWRTLRGMLPHKTQRGQEALKRLKVYEGIPPPYDKQKRMVVPDALMVLRLGKGHKWVMLNELASSVGWRHQAAVEMLESRRLERCTEYYKNKLKQQKLKAKADAQAAGQTK